MMLRAAAPPRRVGGGGGLPARARGAWPAVARVGCPRCCSRVVRSPVSALPAAPAPADAAAAGAAPAPPSARELEEMGAEMQRLRHKLIAVTRKQDRLLFACFHLLLNLAEVRACMCAAVMCGRCVRASAGGMLSLVLCVHVRACALCACMCAAVLCGRCVRACADRMLSLVLCVGACRTC